MLVPLMSSSPLLWMMPSTFLLQIFTCDVDDIKFVINFDFPTCSEDYVHRIGRTGRSNKSGTAYTFFTQNNVKQATDLIAVLNEANQVVNPKLLQMAELPRAFGRGRNNTKWKQPNTKFNRNGFNKQHDGIRTRTGGLRDQSQNRGNNRFNNNSVPTGGNNYYTRNYNTQPLSQSQSNGLNNSVNRQTTGQTGFGQYNSGTSNSWFSNQRA